MAVRLTVAELRAADRKPGEEFEAVLVLRKCSVRTARNDNTYLAIELGDRGGTFSANVFSDSALSEIFRELKEGIVVWVAGRIDHYQGRFSPKLTHARLIGEQEIESIGGIESLVETSPENPGELQQELVSQIARISHAPLRRTVELALESVAATFYTAPAAVAMHHAYRGGLLEHTVHVARNCIALLPLYSEVHYDLALAGAILHDIGKALEYAGSLAPGKTRSGQMQGHVVLGYRLVRRAGMVAQLSDDLLERLEHIVLSHQGELEWGAAVMAATPEAVFVSMIDNLDAKMGMVQRALRIGESAEFSEYLPGLKSPLLRTLPVVPEPIEETAQTTLDFSEELSSPADDATEKTPRA
ncbi:MAG: 3'-5' exoribonuclease YhaM family protein [Opitutaceae bacterium]